MTLIDKYPLIEREECLAEQRQWWVQSDQHLVGYGPFTTESAAWDWLLKQSPWAVFTRQQAEDEGWYVGFITGWINPVSRSLVRVG